MPRREVRAVIALAIILSILLLIMAMSKSCSKGDVTPLTTEIKQTCDTIAPVEVKHHKSGKKKSNRKKNPKPEKQAKPIVDGLSPHDRMVKTLIE